MKLIGSLGRRSRADVGWLRSLNLGPSIVEQVVDVFVADLGERRIGARLRDLLQERLKDVVQLFAGLFHAKADETERRLGIEDHDEDDAVADELNVDVRLFTLVKLGGKLLLLEQLGHAARRGDVAGGQRREARGVDVVDIARRRDELPVLVDDEDDLGVRIPDQAIDHRLDEIELLLVHHHLRVDHSRPRRVREWARARTFYGARWRATDRPTVLAGGRISVKVRR